MNPYAKYRKLVLGVLLSFCLLFSLTACGKITSGGSDRDEDSQEEEDVSSDAEDEAEGDGDEDAPGQSDENGEPDGDDTAEEAGQPGFVTTPKLEDAQARILAAEENYCAILVYNCPPRTTDVSVTSADGNLVMFVSQYLGMTSEKGVWLLDLSLSEAVDPQEFFQYNVEVTAVVDNGEETRTITGLEKATPEECADSGLVLIDGMPAFVPPCDIYSDYQSFGFIELVYLFSATGIGDLENAEERFQFYAKDGTLLEEVFPDNAFSVDVRTPYVNALFDASSDTAEALAEQLRECEPYMVYTGPGGDTWSVPMIPAEE